MTPDMSFTHLIASASLLAQIVLVLLLMALIERFEGGPAGLDNLAAAIGESRDTIEDVIEPFLIQQGYLMRTPRGRVAGRLAYQHYGLKMPERLSVPDLFSE